MKVLETKMKFRAVELSVEEMQDLLDRNHPNNRKPKKGKILQYRRDMDEDNWPLTPEPIVEDEDGRLVDGQNRLAAGIQSGKPQRFILCTGAPRKAITVMDCGANRNVADAARISGEAFTHGEANFGAIARRMAIGLEKTTSTLSIPQTLNFVRIHRKALEYAIVEVFCQKKAKGVTQAAVLAVVARAYYRRGCRERLKEFGEVMLSGLVNNRKQDSAAIRLRNYLFENTTGGRKRSQGMRPAQKIVYAKAALALDHFLKYEEVESLKETGVELFPIPDDPSLVQEEEPQEIAGKIG